MNVAVHFTTPWMVVLTMFLFKIDSKCMSREDMYSVCFLFYEPVMYKSSKSMSVHILLHL